MQFLLIVMYFFFLIVEVKGKLLETTTASQVGVPQQRNRDPVKDKTKQNAILESKLKEFNIDKSAQQDAIARTPAQESTLAEMIKHTYTTLILQSREKSNHFNIKL